MEQLKFKIQNASGKPDANVYICFYLVKNQQYLRNSVWKNGTPLKIGQWYGLSDLVDCHFSTNASGRVYIAYADTADSLPEMPADSLPSPFYCGTRMDKFELTFDGTACGCADLTAIDYWAIPMSLSTSKGGAAVGTLSGVRSGYTARDIYTQLRSLSHPPQSGATIQKVTEAFKAAKNALPVGILEWFKHPKSAVIKKNSGDFVRIVGPNTYPPFGNLATRTPPGRPVTPYNTFESYLAYLQGTFSGIAPVGYPSGFGNGTFAHIAGTFGGVGANPTLPDQQLQDYDLWASLDTGLNLRLKGRADAVGDIDMQMNWLDFLNPAACYGANPNFTLNGGVAEQTAGNTVYGWIWGDFFAGLNIGALGSQVSTSDSRVVGGMPSQDWFKVLAKEGLLFHKLWPEGPDNHWNPWAATLNPMSDAYNFPYAERFSAPQLNLDPAKVDTLTLTLPDTSRVV